MISPDQLPEPELISQPAQFDDLIPQLMGEDRIAVDTESNSLHAYQEQVCLIQFSTSTKDYLVDPITLPNLDALGEVFASPRVEKIFHAAEYDLICLKRDFGFEFEHLFDTQVAARILGWKRVGLGNILETQFGVKLNKKFQRADWKARPLSPEMMRYAQLDTHFLIDLRSLLAARLEEAGLMDLAREDFERGRLVNGAAQPPKERMCWRVNGSHELTPQQMSVLQELCLYRDKVAKKLDRPLFKVVSDRTLVEIARHCPFDLNELQEVPGVRSWLVRRHGRKILSAVRRGLEREPLRPSRGRNPGSAYFNRLDALHTWRKTTARKLGVESDVVLPRDLMEEVVRRNPNSMQSLEEVMMEVPWRLERFGEDILTVLRTKT